MRETSLPVGITSLVLVTIGIALLSVNIVSGGKINVALPLVFMVLAGGFFILVFRLRRKWDLALFLYVPASLFTAFGIIFLLNVLTGDWKSWAYAWLLLLAAIGIGLLLACRERTWHPVLPLAGWGMAIAGLTFFGVFGVITGGFLIEVMAPVFLVLAGLSLRWLHLETILPASVSNKLHLKRRAQDDDEPLGTVTGLVEPLSNRELEVLRLIDSGLTNQQIAEKLTVASSTVKTHINNIYAKMGVQTRVQAVNRARELGLFGS